MELHTAKEEAYEKATMQELGGSPNGTRQDVIYRAMDIHARNIAIAFAEWVRDNRYVWNLDEETTKWVAVWDGYKEYTTEQLFDEFIKEYGK